jgi:hypothetical protein
VKAWSGSQVAGTGNVGVIGSWCGISTLIVTFSVAGLMYHIKAGKHHIHIRVKHSKV